MSFLLDTNVAIHLRDNDPAIKTKLALLSGPLLISAVSHVELENGLLGTSVDSALRRLRLARILANTTILPFDALCVDAYRQILQVTGFYRRKIIDRMIAAQALVHRATLVTCNGEDFRDVPGLALLEW